MDTLLNTAGWLAAVAVVVGFIAIPIAKYRSKKKADAELLARRVADVVAEEAPKRKPNRGG